MPFSLLKLAEQEGIEVDYWDFAPPLEAVYWSHPSLPPVIGLGKHLFSSRARFRCVLAEELGHHFTTVGNAVPLTFYHYSDRLRVTRAEYRALKWAAYYLLPFDKLKKAFSDGVLLSWELAEYFNVTEQMVKFRLRLPDVRQRASWN